MITLQGTIEEIIYKNESNGYTVAILETEDDVVTIVGYMPVINLGETIMVQGNWVYHSNYGQQFKVDTYQAVVPASLNGIEKYLSSGLIPGIGPKIAKKIVEKFGLDSIDILQYNPDRLLEIDGIGKKKAQKIAEAFAEQREIRDIMIFLQEYGISPTYGVRIYKKYGNETISKIRENPYRLSEDIFGIGFKMADKIARNMGVDLRSDYRIFAGIKFTLMEFSSEGHTYVPKRELVDKAQSLLEVERELVEDGITALALKQEIQLENVDNEIRVYYMPFYYAEANVSKKIIELALTELKELDINVEEEINKLERESSIKFAKNQKEAIRQAVFNGVLVITGGPGTGKTTTINSIIKLFENQGLSVVLAAPTGRAAKRMSEATLREAKTIHRLLEYSFVDDETGMAFARDEGTPIDSDVVIIDEVSMVDILLMNNLLKAIMPGTRLILVGDVDQLPSVGPGNVLRDIIDSKVVKVVKLNEIFRQAQESMIIVNAHRINKGEMPFLNVKDKDFFFINKDSNKEVVDTIIELCKERLPKFYGYDPVKDIQVLTPMKKGDTGVNVLNERLQDVLNPKHKLKNEKQVGESIFRVGDKVMQIKNNYRMKWEIVKDDGINEEGEGVFNGDFGYVYDIDEEENEMTVLFDDNKKVVYSFSQLDELKLAYAITIHKSQGSEFPVVVMPICWGPPMLLTRNLLYTAITRAKELVVLVGNKKFLYMMINNNRITKRYSGLNKRLHKVLEFIKGE
ncbi:ATP-dependent DNA helicase, RecD/TraA family [Caloranaerobacter azorensis DSM 13643]|uniref:ATP-dependent RecD2 DNA helicase n=1 Tax=Caloranaerobacter azorensis DSM 13643 TaxID=1121264 RepID=A0A1M5V464_9FIRM|nr:ATP-dependent RecD-like DNA helicase [Caloranaerobacter azorensis]SHH69966.1 ATP-dependent DNA helicase, RecD/TraA family [Caloranaerobacter azorensis DSM 13643]